MAEIRKYTQEFRESAMKMVQEEGLSIPKAASGLGIPPNSLRGWIESATGTKAMPASKAGPRAERDLAVRVRELEAQLRQATLEKEILKKATQYFARTSQ